METGFEPDANHRCLVLVRGLTHDHFMRKEKDRELTAITHNLGEIHPANSPVKRVENRALRMIEQKAESFERSSDPARFTVYQP